MVPFSPAEALGAHAHGSCEQLVEIARKRHNLAVEAHIASASRYSMGFGSQWRDLIVDVAEVFAKFGYRLHKVTPAGYKVPVVNNCLIYVWRNPGAPDAVRRFASSPTRKNLLGVEMLAPELFESGLASESVPPEAVKDDNLEGDKSVLLERLKPLMAESMPVVLVIVNSSPSRLQSIEWGVVEIDDSDDVHLHGRETIWRAEGDVDAVATDGDSFDRGIPSEPVIEPRWIDGAHSDD